VALLGLLRLARSTSLQVDDEGVVLVGKRGSLDEPGWLSGMGESFGKALLERIGLRRKLDLTFLRNCWRAAKSMEGSSSGRISGTAGEAERAAGEMSEAEEKCRVSSSSSSESCRVSSTGEPGCT